MSFQDDILRLIVREDIFGSVIWNERANGELKFSVLCNDTFWWATADCEEVNKETLSELQRALDDTHEICGYSDWGDVLYCARRRKMRPQGAIYKHMPSKIKHLFDACGPERKVEMLNPRDQKEFAA